MKRTALMLPLLLATTGVFADSGSDWLDSQVSRLQDQIAVRNQITVEVKQFQLAQGYVLPNRVMSRSDDKNAFDHEMKILGKTIVMFALAY